MQEGNDTENQGLPCLCASLWAVHHPRLQLQGRKGLDASLAAPSCTLLQPNTDILWCWGRSQWAWWAGKTNPLRGLQTPASLGCPESPSGAAAGKGFTSTCPIGLGKPNRGPRPEPGGCSRPLTP